MTTRTVEVEQTETVEESVAVCDHCGLEATAANSVSFVPLKNKDPLPDNVKGQLLRLKLGKDDLAVVRYDGEYDALHYHTEDCLESATLAEYEPIRAWDEMEDPHGNRVLLAMAWPEITLGVVGFALTVGAVTVGSAPTNFIGMAFGIGFLLAALIVGARQAENPVEELNER